MRLEFGMVKDKPWFYYPEGAEAPDTVFVERINGNTVYLSNGVNIPTKSFYELCEIAVDEDPADANSYEQIEQGNELIDESDFDGSGPSNNPKVGGSLYDEIMGSIKFDQNGVPIASTGTQVEQQTKQIATQPLPRKPQEQPQQPKFDSPLIALAEKGKLAPKLINVQIDVPMLDKTLFTALINSYPEEEIEILLDYLVDRVGIDKIRSLIKQKIRSQYKTPIKKDVTE